MHGKEGDWLGRANSLGIPLCWETPKLLPRKKGQGKSTVWNRGTIVQRLFNDSLAFGWMDALHLRACTHAHTTAAKTQERHKIISAYTHTHTPKSPTGPISERIVVSPSFVWLCERLCWQRQKWPWNERSRGSRPRCPWFHKQDPRPSSWGRCLKFSHSLFSGGMLVSLVQAD